MTTFRQVAAFVAALALCAGNVTVCAGWQPTPEARLACCMDGATCPMHESDHRGRASRHVVSQAQADTCCGAAAQRRDSSVAGSTFAASGAIALVPIAAMITAPTTASPEQRWRALIPPPVSSTPKHLLLSVLLV